MPLFNDSRPFCISSSALRSLEGGFAPSFAIPGHLRLALPYIALGVAAPVFITCAGKCFSKWAVESCSMSQHGECIRQGVCCILAPCCTFSTDPKGQTLERLTKSSLSGEDGCDMSLGWTFNFKVDF